MSADLRSGVRSAQLGFVLAAAGGAGACRRREGEERGFLRKFQTAAGELKFGGEGYS